MLRTQPTSHCCDSMQNCLKTTAHVAKTLVYFAASGASLYIPVTLPVCTAVGGIFAFLGFHELHKMGCGSDRKMVESRTWKHIVAGSLVFGATFALYGLAIKLKAYGLIPTMIPGLLLTFKVAYTDDFFKGNYNFARNLRDPLNGASGDYHPVSEIPSIDNPPPPETV